MFPTSKRAWLTAAGLLAVLVAGQPVGEYLVALTGGSNTPAPYTALSYRNPESAAGGLITGGTVEFVVENVTGVGREYLWHVSIDGRETDHGTVVTDEAAPKRVVSVDLTRPGSLVFAIDGLPQTLTGVVAPATRTSQKKAR